MSDPVEIDIFFIMMIVDDIFLGIEHLDLCSLPVPLESKINLVDTKLSQLGD